VETTGADAVEMESSVIHAICRNFGSRARQSGHFRPGKRRLPLDFNTLMTSDDRVNYSRLAWTLVKSPQKIPQLLAFQRQTVTAARRLGEVLGELLKRRAEG
jgi:hypothetical protein